MHHRCLVTTDRAASGRKQWLIIGARRHSRQVRVGNITFEQGAFIAVFNGHKERLFCGFTQRRVYGFRDSEP